MLWANHGALAVDYGATNTEILNNTCYANDIGGGAGIFIGAGSKGAIVRNNIIVQAGTPISNNGAGGVYISRLQAGACSRVRAMVLVR